MQFASARVTYLWNGRDVCSVTRVCVRAVARNKRLRTAGVTLSGIEAILFGISCLEFFKRIPLDTRPVPRGAQALPETTR